MRPADCSGPARGSTNSSRSWVKTTRQPDDRDVGADDELVADLVQPLGQRAQARVGHRRAQPVAEGGGDHGAVAVQEPPGRAWTSRSPASPRISWLKEESLVSACSKTKAPRTLVGDAPLMATAKA